MDFAQLVSAALNLPTLERVKLVEKLMASLESSFKLSDEKPHPRDTVYNLLHEIYLSEEDRDDLRRSIWEGFGSTSFRAVPPSDSNP